MNPSLFGLAMVAPDGAIFSARVLAGLVYAALGLTGLGALTLVVLLVRDWRRGELW